MMRDRLIRCLGSGLGTGRSPIVPGTVGSLLGIPIALAVWPLPIPARIAVLAVLALAAVPIAGRTETILGVTDPHEIVIDEIIAIPIALFAVPPSPGWWAVGFVLFRIFDVVKPFPVSGSQKLPGGWGVVVDDVLAGFYTAAAVHVLRWIHG